MNAFYARLASFIISIFLFHVAVSQTDCGFDESHRNLVASDTSFRNSIKNLNTRLQLLNQQRMLAPNAPLGVVYRIPVVVHIIHKGEAVGVGTNISDAQIQSAIISMSQFYRGTLGSSPDAEIEFQLASLDPTCAPTNGIVRIDGSSVTSYSTDGLVTGGSGNELALKNLSRWSNRNYYNIWIVSEINNNNGGGGIQGFAYFPGAQPTMDGAVILYNAFGYDPTNTIGYTLKTSTDENKTAIHELGHAFSLYHSFEGDDANNDNVADQCPANTDCTSEGDWICDTDPHRRSLSNCPSGPNVCGGILDNTVKNFMDYSSAACQDRFTLGQITRMRDAISLYRSSLPVSQALNSSFPLTPYTAPAAACASNTGPIGLSSHYAGIMNIEINGKNFESDTPPLDNPSAGYVNWSIDCHNLTQLVRGGTYQFSATVLAANQEQLRAWIDYNNDNSFNNATEQIYLNSSIPSHATDFVTVTGSFTVPNTAVVNSVLRLRVVDELSTVYGLPAISTGCYSPQYGQTEDFPLYMTAILPVVLESFTGRKSGDDVVLNWKTSFEQNAKEFQIERSSDGVNFVKIGAVATASNARTGRQYSFIDRNVVHENNYYRLRSLDVDGQFELSKIVTIRNVLAVRSPFSVLSNPVQNNLDIQFNSEADGPVKVRLTDMNGKILINWSGRDMANRKLRLNLANQHLSSGIYVLHANVQGKEYTKKVVVK